MRGVGDALTFLPSKTMCYTTTTMVAKVFAAGDDHFFFGTTMVVKVFVAGDDHHFYFGKSDDGLSQYSFFVVRCSCRSYQL